WPDAAPALAGPRRAHRRGARRRARPRARRARATARRRRDWRRLGEVRDGLAGVLDEDRRRPGALLGLGEAVVGRVVARAGARGDATAPLVALAAHEVGVHGETRRLDRPHVVEGVAAARDEVRVAERGDAARRIRLAGEGAPGVLDEPLDRLALAHLGADAHHLDPGHQAPAVRGVVALAAAEVLESLGRERAGREIGAAGQL